MANIIYNAGLGRLLTEDADAAGTVIRCLLERSTSTYTPNKDHDFISDTTGLVEISVASYARQTVASKAVVVNDTDDRIEFDFADIAFGNLETGQTVLSLILYFQVGGDDTTPADDVLLCRIDTATGLPATLGGGPFTVTIAATGLIQIA